MDFRLKAFQKLDWPFFDLVEQKCYYRLCQQTKLKKKMLNNYLILNRYALKMCWDGTLLSVSRGVFLKIVCVFVSNLPFTSDHLVVVLRHCLKFNFQLNALYCCIDKRCVDIVLAIQPETHCIYFIFRSITLEFINLTIMQEASASTSQIM